MGVDLATLEFMLKAREAVGPFGRTLLLGRQRMLFTQPVYRALGEKCLRKYRPAAEFAEIEGDYCENLFRFLGADELHVLDNSAYEGASVIHDLNEPLPARFHRQYDTVVDIGTLEHVFNIGEAMKSMAALVRLGGRFLSLNVANHHLGHGFWQFSPEAYFRVFEPQNGFEPRMAWLAYGGGFHELVDPEAAGRRLPLATPGYTYICFGAERVSEAPMFASGWPVQADYRAAWVKFQARRAQAEGDAARAQTILEEARARHPNSPAFRDAG